MAIQQVPDFWTYLSGGISTGFDSFQRERERQRLQQQQGLQNMGYLGSLLNQGVIDSTLANEINQRLGTKSTPFQPSTTERKRKILATPGGLGQASNEDLIGAGLPTQVEQQEEAAIGRRLAIQQKYEQQGIIALTDAERKILNLPTTEEESIARLGKLNPQLEDAASRYVDQVLAQYKGRVNPQQMQAVAAQAYARFASDKSTQELMKGIPEPTQYAQSFFSRAVSKKLMDQQEMDIRREIAAINAEARKSGQLADQRARLMTALNAAAANEEKRADAIINGNQGMLVQTYLNETDAKKKEKAAPFMKGPAEEYIKRTTRAQALRQAWMAYTQGALSDEQVSQALARWSGDEGQHDAAATAATSKPAAGGKQKITQDQYRYLTTPKPKGAGMSDAEVRQRYEVSP